MHQRIKLLNGYHNFENNALFYHIKTRSNDSAEGKRKPFQPEFLTIQIQNEFLRSLPEIGLQELLPLMELTYPVRGQNLYQPDDQINYLYFPETAIISDFQILQNGKTAEIAMTGREGIVGISSLFFSQISTNWIQVSIPGRALRIDAKTFQQKINAFEPFQKMLFDLLNLHIAQISQKVVCNYHHSVKERLCCWLLMISDRCGLKTLPVTQEQMGGFLGVHRPIVTLVTQSLRESDVIEYSRGKISILDKVKLEFSACDCYSAAKLI